MKQGASGNLGEDSVDIPFLRVAFHDQTSFCWHGTNHKLRDDGDVDDLASDGFSTRRISRNQNPRKGDRANLAYECGWQPVLFVHAEVVR